MSGINFVAARRRLSSSWGRGKKNGEAIIAKVTSSRRHTFDGLNTAGKEDTKEDDFEKRCQRDPLDPWIRWMLRNRAALSGTAPTIRKIPEDMHAVHACLP